MKETFLFISLTLAAFTAVFFLAYTALIIVYGLIKLLTNKIKTTWKKQRE